MYAHGHWLRERGTSYTSLAAARKLHFLSEATSTTACDTSKYPITALGLDLWILVNSVATIARERDLRAARNSPRLGRQGSALAISAAAAGMGERAVEGAMPPPAPLASSALAVDGSAVGRPMRNGGTQ